AAVALLPDDRGQKALMISKSADANGQFEIQAAPGAYHLYSWVELDGEAYRNDEFMKKYDERGTAVRVETSGNVVANLNVLEEVSGQ
ncbi:MAG TPA: hypothetical protein VFO86_11305, partial [Terriglobia bacterium]|nr:hypothetical protein [Terriglobia bacterium]